MGCLILKIVLKPQQYFEIGFFHLYFRNHPRYEGETEACEHITNWLEKNTRDFSWKSADISYSGVDEITQPPKSSEIPRTKCVSELNSLLTKGLIII